MPGFQFRQVSCVDQAPAKGFVQPSLKDRLDSQLAQNIALLLVDKNYESAENQALFSLTSIMKDYICEIGLEMKQTSEAQGRTEVSLIDALNTAYDYGLPQKDL